jgi:hypothetical protein
LVKKEKIMDNFDLRKYLAENRLFNFRPKLPITDYVDIDQEELNQLYDRLKDEFEGNEEKDSNRVPEAERRKR